MSLTVLPMNDIRLAVEHLAGKKEVIVREWLEMIIHGYEPGTAHFLQQDQDGFRNPVGQVLRENLPVLFAALLEDRIPASYRENLDAIIRVRAVQDFSPSEAVAFIFDLKQIVRRKVAAQDRLDPQGGRCAEFESRIDVMALLAFDLFTACREQMYEIRLNESRRRTHVSEKMAAKTAGRSKDPA